MGEILFSSFWGFFFNVIIIMKIYFREVKLKIVEYYSFEFDLKIFLKL